MAHPMFTKFEPNVSFRYLLESPAFSNVSFLCKAISLPKIDQGEVVIDYVNTDFKVKGKSRWQDVTLQIYDTVGGEGSKKQMGGQDIHQWLLQHHDSSTGEDGWAWPENSPPNSYKQIWDIKVLDPRGNPVYKWELNGAFMSAIDFGEMDWAAEDAVIANVTIKYDWAQYIPL